jgi:hypothetical protein
MSRKREWLSAVAGIAVLLLLPVRIAADSASRHHTLSAAGELAQKRIHQRVRTFRAAAAGCFNEPDCGEDREEPLEASQLQAETTIAVDATGQHVVVGFNDFRGFARDPISVSGFMYSDDGGRTFVDGGQLPTPGTDVVDGFRLPEVFGDPDVKWVTGCTFVYTSLALEKIGTNGLAQTLVFHRSTDCGHTWQGPFRIPPSVNPNGRVDVNGDAFDAADKELTDIDPDTGRYIVCWSNFTDVAAGGVEISCTYSDDILSATPTFAPRRVVAARASDGQGSSVRFAGNGSPNVVVAWSSFTSFYTNRVSIARSTDNGVTWSAPADVTTDFLTMDEVLGNDRVNNNPSIAIDRSSGPFANRVYLVYSSNNSRDGADVRFQRSTDGGVTFSAPILINSRPGADRAQWFPFVSVDNATGRVWVFYYDQGVDTSGDLTEVTYTYSDDGGTTWQAPAPLTDRPFKAGWGNDTSQPNLGDYNQSAAKLGAFWASYALTRPVGFTDGQPSTSLTTPDVEAKVLDGGGGLPVRLGTPSYTDTGGNGSIDGGEQISLDLPLTNAVTNPLTAATLVGVSAVLSTTTPHVTVLQGRASYPDLAPGATATNTTPFRLLADPRFVSGQPIELVLDVTASTGTARRLLTLETGTPVATTLLSENFDGVAPGALPAGWAARHGAGPNTVPWTTSNTFAPSLCGTSNRAFHTEANDVPNASTFARWERLFSPSVTVPETSSYVTVDFDVCYDTEDDPVMRVLAYDGMFLRVTDLTPGHTLRSVLAEAFEREFTTDGFKHYPKHFPRNSNPDYFDDMSAWAGFSNGVQHVHLVLPGMAGTVFQLRFEYAQDDLGICSDVRPGHACGVSVDNVVVRNVVAVTQLPVSLTVTPAMARDPSTNQWIATLTVNNRGGTTARNVRLTTATLGGTIAIPPLPSLGTIRPGDSAVATVRFPAAAGTAGATSVLRVSGVFSGGTFGSSFRVVLPQ